VTVITASVRTKLLVAFGVVVALMLAVGLIGIARLHSDNADLGRVASKVVPGTRAVGDINALMNKYRKDQLHYIVARPADRPLGIPGSIAGDLGEDLNLMGSALAQYRSSGLIADPASERLLTTFTADFYRYVALTAGFRALADRGRTVAAGEVVGNGAGDHQWDKLKAVIGAWSDHEVRTARAAEASSSANYNLSVDLIVGLLIAAVAVAAAIAIVLSRRMTRSVREIGAAAKAIAEGDIDQRVAVRSRDEFGAMARDFDTMIDYLRSTVGVAETIARGELDVEIKPRSRRDALGTSLLTMTKSLRRLAGENQALLDASRMEANTDALTATHRSRRLPGGSS
jgi:HAMP domain-containing protein